MRRAPDPSSLLVSRRPQGSPDATGVQSTQSMGHAPVISSEQPATRTNVPQCRFRPRLMRLAPAFLAFAFAAGALPAWAADADVAAALKSLQSDRPVSRTVTLRDLGFTGPVSLTSVDAGRDIYLPVPADMALDQADLSLNAHYLRADGGSTTFVLSLDGYPVAARAPDQESGTFGIDLGVDGAPRKSGFVRLGVSWSSAINAEMCGDNRAIGNVVEIDPSTRFTYRYHPAGVRDLLTAWTALPSAPGVLVAGRSLGADAYDAAWRIGIALERAGKHARFVALPAVGDEVDLGGVEVPAGLSTIPAFAALSAGGTHRLADPAEVGAYLALAGGNLADLAVADASLTANVRTAFDALAAEIEASGPEAKAAFDALRSGADNLTAGPTSPDGIGIASLGGLPVIAVAPAAAGKASALFSSFWRQIATSRSLVVKAVKVPASASGSISLASLGGGARSFDVLASGDWSASFDLSALSANGGSIPATAVIDVAAAPGASASLPVVSIFLNDYLLAAKRLYADGQPERLTADIPEYALQPSNVLRVSFQRQPVSDRCRDTPQAYPVAVLPSSHITLSTSKPSADFLGVVPRLADKAKLLVPASFLADAPASLGTVVRLADAAGLSPEAATLALAEAQSNGAATSAMPDVPFLAVDVDVPVPDDRRVTVSGNQLALASAPGTPLLDIANLDRLGVIQAVSGRVPGLIYRQVGAQGPVLDAPILLSKGDIAIVSDAGKVVEIDSRDPGGSVPPENVGTGWSWSRIWDNRGEWGVPLTAVVVVLILLLFARAAFVRNRRDRG